MQQTKDINAAKIEFDRLRRLATLRHYETMARVAEAQRAARNAQLAKTAAHYMAMAAEAGK